MKFAEICTFFGDFLVKVGRTHLLFRGDATQSTSNDPGPDIVLTRNSMFCQCLFSEIIRKFIQHYIKGVQWNSVTKLSQRSESEGRQKKSCSSCCFHLCKAQTCWFAAMQSFTHTHTYTHQTLHPRSLRFRQTA